ncbi:MAG: hypothetical protein CSA34_08310 [Desulfobulbus propionicus]|nr:MAG: hypothetical protein CSA34_08310 [Desulfobulbus propionicus]
MIADNPVNGSGLSLAAAEREHILKILDSCNGNRSRTAELLGIGRKTLYRRLTSYGVS